MKHEGRLHALDALRGLAALYVVIYHDILRYPRFMLGLPMDPHTVLLPGLTQMESGVIPVLWFFLISGFVITWTIDRCRTPMDFAVSRFSRLYPAYWAALAISVALQFAWPLPGPSLGVVQVLANTTMLQEYAGFPNVDGVYWSLTIELLFYAYAIALFTARLWRHVHWVAFAWSVIALAWAILMQAGLDVPWRVRQLLMLEFAPFFAGGMMLYRLWRGEHPVLTQLTLAISAAAVLVYYRPVSAATVFVVGAMIFAATRGWLRWLAAPPLLWLGSISYALYLSHQTTSFLVIRALDAAGVPHWAGVAAGIAVALALASAITILIERPALRAIRDVWRRVRPEPVSDGAAVALPTSPTGRGSRG